MGDRIDELPVDQIVPSSDEKQILESMFVNAVAEPTGAQAVPKRGNEVRDFRQGMAPVVREPYEAYEASRNGGKGSIRQEIQTVGLLTVLFFVCALPKMDEWIGTMIPFLRQTPIFRLLFRSVCFMMIAYILINSNLMMTAVGGRYGT